VTAAIQDFVTSISSAVQPVEIRLHHHFKGGGRHVR
jgi:hypothetical protein